MRAVQIGSTDVDESTELFLLLESMVLKLESLSSRFSAVESSTKRDHKTSEQGCFRCGDFVKFKRDCLLVKRMDTVKAGSTICTSEKLPRSTPTSAGMMGELVLQSCHVNSVVSTKVLGNQL